MTEADKWNQIRKAKALLELSKEEKLPDQLQEQLVALSVLILQHLVEAPPQGSFFVTATPSTKGMEYPD